jgi:hypothetical protein
MARTFGSKYEGLIKLNPNKKSLPNNNPGIVNAPSNTKNPYAGLISSGITQKSLFNTNPGIELGLLKTNNPYTELINRWDFTKATPFAPFVGRDPVIPMMDTYYVDFGYVEDGYVEVKQVPIL